MDKMNCASCICIRKPISPSTPRMRIQAFLRRLSAEEAQSRDSGSQLQRCLTCVDLVLIGIGSMLGAGIYGLLGNVANQNTGPALPVSVFFAGLAATLPALCYAELACRFPCAGTAYRYAYICMGEGFAWMVGWALILENLFGCAAIASSVTSYLAELVGLEEHDYLRFVISHHTILGINFEVKVDLIAATVILLITAILCLPIAVASCAENVATGLNIIVMCLIIVAGIAIGVSNHWHGSGLPDGYFPFGLSGVLAGAGNIFFSYVGFDSITSIAEEVKDPEEKLPRSMAIAFTICCIFYTVMSAVVVGLVPYHDLVSDTPISSAFSKNKMFVIGKFIAGGAILTLVTTLFGSLLAQPRILLSMARDGLLPSFFSDINERTCVPVKSTCLCGGLAALLALILQISDLYKMVNIGTLLGFIVVAISLLMSRYVSHHSNREISVTVLWSIVFLVVGACVFALGATISWFSYFIRTIVCSFGVINFIGSL